MIVAGLSMVQGRTIDSQRNVIHLLFLDSQELNAIKVHDQQQKHSAAANAQSDQQQKSDAQEQLRRFEGQIWKRLRGPASHRAQPAHSGQESHS